MRHRPLASADRQRPARGSVLLVVLGVLTVLSLIGLSFVLFTGTERKTAVNFRFGAQAELLVEQELQRLDAIQIADMYPATPTTSGVAWRLLNESHDYPDSADGWLFGWLGDGTDVLQVSFGDTGAPQVNNDARDSEPDSIWRQFTLSDGNIARVATLVIDHGGLANINTWGNIQHPTTGTDNAHHGLGSFELSLRNVLGLDGTNSDERDTYRSLFLGRTVGVDTFAGRYGIGLGVRPGVTGISDDRDTDDWRNGLDDDVDDTWDEDAAETIDEPDEYCFSNPGGAGTDADRPFDLVDLWELLSDRPFVSRLESVLGAFDLDAPFEAGTKLGSFRQNLVTLSADPEWVGVGAIDTDDRLQVRLDLNHASGADLEAAFRQAGFLPSAAKQMAVNIIDYRDADADVTVIDGRHGHERQPYVNEFFVGKWKRPGSPNEFRAVAVELYNPYDTDINVYQWELRIDIEGDTPSSQVVVLDDGVANTFVPANSYLTIVSLDPAQGVEQYVFAPAIDGKTIVLEPPVPPDPPAGTYALPWPEDKNVYRIRLLRARQIGLRPNVTNGELVVDDTGSEIDFHALNVPGFPPFPWAGGYVDEDVQRPDAEVNDFQDNITPGPRHTLGKWNDPADVVKPVRYSVPIPNRGTNTFGSVGDLGQVLTHTQNGNVPYTDDYVGMPPAQKERLVKFDLTGDWYAGGGTTGLEYPERNVLDLLCVKRPDHDGLDNDGDGTVDEAGEADWPIYGRLNINTASLRMLERALANGPYSKTQATVLANRIVARRENVGPFRHIGDLFRGQELAECMAYFADWDGGVDDDADGEQAEKDERDARFRFLANLITTRSNVFTVFVTVEIRDPDRGELLASRRAVAVLDRSRAGMTVRYSPGGTRVAYVTSPVVRRGFRWLSD